MAAPLQQTDGAAILLTADEYAEVMGVDRRAIDRWRAAGFGPGPVNHRPQPLYDLADVQRFLTDQPQEQPA